VGGITSVVATDLLQPGVNVPREMPERPPNPFMLFCRDIKDEVCRHPTIPPYCVVLYSSSSLALPNSLCSAVSPHGRSRRLETRALEGDGMGVNTTNASPHVGAGSSA
jgi:hypothetical protein